MQVGHTIAPTVSNLFDGVDLATVFTFTWRNGSSSQIYNGAAKPTLTETGTLKLTLVPKAPYVLRNSSGRTGSLEAQGTVSLPAFSILYVDAVNGSDNNVGSTSDAPLQTLSKALSNIAENGTIVLLSNCTANEARVQKDHLTIKSKDGEKYCLTLETTRLMSGVTQMTLDSLLLDVKYIPYSSSSPSAASLLLKNCSGAISATMNDINEVTLEKSEIGGTVYVASKFTLKDSTFTGTFHTKDFAAEGQCTLETIHNSPSKISGTITDDSSVVQVKPAQLQHGELLLEVPDSFSDELVEKLALSDDQSGFYAIQRCKLYNGTYLGVAHRINSANGQLSIWQDPVLGGSVKDLYRNWRVSIGLVPFPILIFLLQMWRGREKILLPPRHWVRNRS